GRVPLDLRLSACVIGDVTRGLGVDLVNGIRGSRAHWRDSPVTGPVYAAPRHGVWSVTESVATSLDEGGRHQGKLDLGRPGKAGEGSLRVLRDLDLLGDGVIQSSAKLK
ncbi:hypothetical protein BaRGS_00026049, partial [Batillaria attramentaria]